jgi:uncharacterized protein (DUF2384 family)
MWFRSHELDRTILTARVAIKSKRRLNTSILNKQEAMLTTKDKEDIRRIIVEMLHAKSGEFPTESGRIDEIEQLERLLSIVAQVRDLIFHEGFTDLRFVNPKTGETRVIEVKAEARPIVEVTARAMEVFGSREKALRWLNTPLRSLGDRTPLSLLNTPEGVAQVQDTLGRVEHGVW